MHAVFKDRWDSPRAGDLGAEHYRGWQWPGSPPLPTLRPHPSPPALPHKFSASPLPLPPLPG